jgi:hypothetical protein
LIISAAGLAAGSEAARAVSLGEAIASFLNPGAHPSAKGQKPIERSAERTQEHIVKHPRLKHSHLGKPPAVTVTVRAPVERERQPGAPPAVSAKTPADEPDLVPVADPLKPHSVQTFTVSPPTTPPVVAPAAEAMETTRPAINIGRELPQLAAAPTVVEDEEEPPVRPLADASAPVVRYDAILFDLLLLALVAGALLSINSRTPARLPVLLRPSLRGRLRPLLAEIDRRSWGRRLFHRAELTPPKSAGRADAPFAPALAPPWDLALAPAGTPIAWPPARQNEDGDARPELTLPELEEQLARIVRDQIAVPLRKAS